LIAALWLGGIVFIALSVYALMYGESPVRPAALHEQIGA
jgi:hypothetical protein